METLWPLAVPVISVVIVGIGIFVANSAKFFTIREHQAFSDVVNIAFNNVRVEIDEQREDIQRELDQIFDRVKVIEQTRPTTGELQAASRHRAQEKD